MAQRDYVGRGRTNTRRKKTNSRKKRTSSGISKTMIALAVAVLITFIGGLYFIAHNKTEEAVILPSHGNHTSNGLPPKPEERWRYIKELENRQIGVQTPTEPTAGGEVQTPAQLTDEQRQLLEQMQADMRQQPTHLNEVPYNDQVKSSAANHARNQQNQQSFQTTPAPRPTPAATPVQPRQVFSAPVEQQPPRQAPAVQQVQQPPRQAPAAQQVQQPPRQAPAVQQVQQPPRQAPAAQQVQQPPRQAPAAQQVQQPPRQAPAAQQVQQPHQAPVTAIQPAPQTKTEARAEPKAEAKAEKEPAEKAQRWLIQCGSFKAMDQAESIRAQLAFGGIESRITSNGGWNRVMLGPYSTRAGADKSLQNLRASGVSNCIPIASGG
ncbi:cell division protein FtsN [Sodalis sp. RH24]|uniref:cell division protein FtsN n=1 Tax=unclassified Sodalis (in: enterobacteria) TaxID=2636512 RepID=UPI003965B914